VNGARGGNFCCGAATARGGAGGVFPLARALCVLPASCATTVPCAAVAKKINAAAPVQIVLRKIRFIVHQTL
jgi:hypothetical protein